MLAALTISLSADLAMITYQGSGVVNKLINKLPFELHIPGYKFCGPGTRLKKRLERGDIPVNQLDKACRAHDIAYSKNKDNLSERHRADKILAEKSWERVKDNSASLSERAAAAAVTGIMKTKRFIGAGNKTKKKQKKRVVGRAITKKNKAVALRKIVTQVKKASLKSSINPVQDAMLIARKAIKSAGGRKKLTVPRILPVPKIGGALPLIPIFAALSAAGALSGGLANVVKAINQTKMASKQLQENHRHNKAMEGVALGKGLYLKPFRKGLGLHLKQSKN